MPPQEPCIESSDPSLKRLKSLQQIAELESSVGSERIHYHANPQGHV